jgi:hypothetical protein
VAVHAGEQRVARQVAVRRLTAQQELQAAPDGVAVIAVQMRLAGAEKGQDGQPGDTRVRVAARPAAVVSQDLGFLPCAVAASVPAPVGILVGGQPGECRLDRRFGFGVAAVADDDVLRFSAAVRYVLGSGVPSATRRAMGSGSGSCRTGREAGVAAAVICCIATVPASRSNGSSAGVSRSGTIASSTRTNRDGSSAWGSSGMEARPAGSRNRSPAGPRPPAETAGPPSGRAAEATGSGRSGGASGTSGKSGVLAWPSRPAPVPVAVRRMFQRRAGCVRVRAARPAVERPRSRSRVPRSGIPVCSTGDSGSSSSRRRRSDVTWTICSRPGSGYGDKGLQVVGVDDQQQMGNDRQHHALGQRFGLSPTGPHQHQQRRSPAQPVRPAARSFASLAWRPLSPTESGFAPGIHDLSTMPNVCWPSGLKSPSRRSRPGDMRSTRSATF